MALKAFFILVLAAAIMVGLALPTPSRDEPEAARSQIATVDLGAR